MISQVPIYVKYVSSRTRHVDTFHEIKFNLDKYQHFNTLENN